MTKKQRKQLIKAIEERLEDMEVSATMLGIGEEGRADYAAAIVGIITEPQVSVAYLRSKVIEELQRMNDWTYDEAVEWYEYNTVRSVPYIDKKSNPFTLIDDIEV